MEPTFSRTGLLAIAFAILASAPRPGIAGDNLESLHEKAVFETPDGGARAYRRTVQANFPEKSFVAEVTVTIKGGQQGNGCAFFGLGKGVADPHSFHEPTTKPSLCLRLCPSDFVGGQVAVFSDGTEAGQGSSEVGNGTHRLRLTWDAASKRALFEISKHWDGNHFHADSSVTVEAASIAFNSDGRLFVGGAGGDLFSDFSVRTLTAAEVKKVSFGESFRDDPSAKTWLASGDSRTSDISPEMTQFLKPLAGSMRILACWYNGSRPIASRSFSNDGMHTNASRWTSQVQVVPLADDTDAMDVTLTFKLVEGSASPAGVAAAFDFADWNPSNYVLIPASVYNGNRQRIVGGGYANGLARTDLYKKDLPLSVRQLPHLELETGKPSRIEVNACNASTPAICFYDRKRRQGFIVLAEQNTRMGGKVLDNGMVVEESPDRHRATLIITAPGVRAQKPEFVGFSASPDRGVALTAGDTVSIRLRVYRFETPNIPGLLDKFMAVRKCVTGASHARNLYPMSEVIRLMTQRIDGRYLNGPDSTFYGSVNADWLCLGWVGGLMNTFPMLALGDEIHLQRVANTFDFAITHAQGKAGYFYEVRNRDGGVRAQEAYGELPQLSLTRRNGDVLFWMIKQFKLLQAQNRASAIKPEWDQGVRRLSDAFVATWKKDGQWGNYVNVDTGQVAVYNSSGGAMAIGGLALAADYYKNAEYLRIAEEAANFYYQRDFVNLGMTTGACADILHNADSETAAGLMTALMALYDTTGDMTWLEKSRNVANLCATWTVSYDYELPKDTQLAMLGAKLTGAVWASTQNKHGAPGICTSSGDPLFKIYRATGDARYAELMHDILHAHAEGIQPDGEISERLTYCDADSRGTRGSGSTGWNELNGILMAMELPGIYLRTDADRFYVFDAVEAKIISRDASGVKVEIHNPTKFDARVSIFAENSEQAKKPQGYVAFLNWPKYEVKAGETVQVLVK